MIYSLNKYYLNEIILTVFSVLLSIPLFAQITLNAPTGGSNYQWHDESGPITGETNSNYITNLAGVYFATFNDGICDQATDYTVIVDGNSPNSEVTLDASAIGGSYQWYEDGFLMTGETNAQITVIAETTPIQYSSMNNNCNSSPTFTVLKTAVILPVELITFKGKVNWCDVNLRWVSAITEGFSHFEVERSYDGVSFDKIGSVDGPINSQSILNYSFKDYDASEINYYRLKMIDLDGSFEYSNSLPMVVDCGESNIIIYPNPILKENSKLNLRLTSNKKDIRIDVIDMNGRLLKQFSFEAEPLIINAYQIDISGLSAGIYTLKIEGERKGKMFVIQE